MNCTDPVREDLSRLAAGELDATASEQALAHVEHCPECSRELDFLADFLVAAERAPHVQSRSSRSWVLWVAGLAAAAALVLFVAHDRRSMSTGGFAIDRSIPRFVEADLREPSEPLARAFAQAMDPYTQHDFPRAVESLSAFLATHADHGPARFYRGIAALESGDRARAAEDFAAVAASSSGYLGEHARWRLANLRLLEERRDEAAAILRGLRDAQGEFSANAVALLAQLDPRD